MRKLIFIYFFIFLIFFSLNSINQARGSSKEEKEELIQYLKDHWDSPENYVIKKFSDYDIVIIGEYHRIKHDVELIHNLIPRLYQIGVYNLGIEFGCSEYQEKADLLVTAENYDQDLARWLMFKTFVAWGYTEYMDIYRRAWELNKTLPKDKPKFRVVHLGYRPDFSAMQEEMTPELMKKVFHKGDADEYMAKMIIEEFVNKNKKALIYCGINHAFTHYNQPIYNFEKKEFVGLKKNRMGNIVYQKVPERVFLIFLHSPWPSKASPNEECFPVGGIIDEIMQQFEDKRIGFDVKNSLFGRLRDEQTYHSIGYDKFNLETFCDGYIYQKPFKDYEGCTFDENFITKDNFEEAINNLPNPKARKLVSSPEVFIKVLLEDTEKIIKRIRNLR